VDLKNILKGITGALEVKRLLKEEKDRILAKLDEMDQYILELEEMMPEQEEYLKDMIKKRACEKTIELAIESVIDACSMVVSLKKLGVPSDEDSILYILLKKKIVPISLFRKLKEIKGFRNIIVHKYGDVNDAMAYEFLSTELKDFKGFKDIMEKYLKKVR
jgi:uncharacterized protein YutE (UPF0331/DUF86 family)